MFDRIKESFLNMVTSRSFLLIIALLAGGFILLQRIFTLQIVNGETYLDNFMLKSKKERSITATRGNIYDRKGNLLAYNELAYFVTIEDVYESGKTKNRELNHTIYELIQLIEESGDDVINDFDIYVDSNDNYQFTMNDNKELMRFLADVYGHASTDDLSHKEEISTADDVISFLCAKSKYGIGTYTEDGETTNFVPEEGFSKEDIIKILTIRYAMSANSYQKYIATTVAKDVSDKTVAVVMENADELSGVAVAEDTIRKYVDSTYFSQIIGYTGKVSQDELAKLQESDPSYSLNDMVGKAGIEAQMESELHGTKGKETVYVDNMGKIIEITDRTESVAGNDLYLTIDDDLQKAAYNIIEQKIAGILLSKIQNIKEYKASENSGSSDIRIAIYDVYFALINNNIIDTSHFSANSAGDTEINVLAKYKDQKQKVFAGVEEELLTNHTIYSSLSDEYKNYESYIVTLLGDNGIIDNSLVDKEDEVYISWKKDESISLTDYLKYLISKNWIDVTKLNLDSKYSDSEEIYDQMVKYTFECLQNDKEFEKRIYKYMIKSDIVSGKEICQILCEQNIVEPDTEEEDKLYKGGISAYNFMLNRISNLDITPAQLALDPFSGSMVITDVNTGDVLALVSYPSYDNNLMANGVNAEYFASLQNDKSTPLLNYATQEKTAPGSTFKMVSATAGLMEGVINTSSIIRCNGVFDRFTPGPTCWIYPRGTHGDLNVTGGIKNSCNCFFYEVGYKLSTENGTYNSEEGLANLGKYADLYGLSETSGIEIEESAPKLSDEDPVRSAIGQGTNNFTTVGLARYVTAVANNGTCYNLTLLDKLTDHNGNLLEDYQAKIRNHIDMDTSYWDAIHQGMRGVVEAKTYFQNFGVTVAGKTGTAQQSDLRPNHALFVCYAAPQGQPEIALATRIAFGYSSDYAAQTAQEVLTYYYKLEDEENILTGTADTPTTGAIGND